MSSGSHTGRGQIKGSHFRVRDEVFIYLIVY